MSDDLVNKKMDRRKKYTRMVLRDSLIGLLKTKPITTITVKEICEQADINRSTFYAHYYDQYDLLDKIEEEVIADIDAYLSQYDFSRDEESLQMVERLLDYAAANFELFHTLLIENSDHSFENRVMELARKYFNLNLGGSQDAYPALSEYGGTFVISGSIYVIKQWLANDMDQPAKEISQLIISFKPWGRDA